MFQATWSQINCKREMVLPTITSEIMCSQLRNKLRMQNENMRNFMVKKKHRSHLLWFSCVGIHFCDLLHFGGGLHVRNVHHQSTEEEQKGEGCDCNIQVDKDRHQCCPNDEDHVDMGDVHIIGSVRVRLLQEPM